MSEEGSATLQVRTSSATTEDGRECIYARPNLATGQVRIFEAVYEVMTGARRVPVSHPRCGGILATVNSVATGARRMPVHCAAWSSIEEGEHETRARTHI